MSHEETILYKWRYGDCCKEGTMWFVTYFTSMIRDLPFEYCFMSTLDTSVMFLANKRIHYYHYMVLLPINFRANSTTFCQKEWS